jgi:hypothetical protein
MVRKALDGAAHVERLDRCGPGRYLLVMLFV